MDSRESKEADSIRRRRECEKCLRRFTTYERIDEIPYMVVKKDGRRERFDRQKVLSGLLRALMDVRNSSDAWDLRCLVREKLIEFLQKNYPGSLPRYRGEMETAAKDGLTVGARQTPNGDPLVAGR